MKTCPKCQTSHMKEGIYCSRKCANSRQWSDADKLKKSVANKGKPGYSGPRKRGIDRNNAYIPSMIAERWNKTLSRFSEGKIQNRDTLRKILSEVVGYRCAVAECGVSSWLGKEITLQVDHIDGNAGNNMPNNVRLICANCHSQTLNFGARNKGSGRKARGLPLK